MKLQNIEDDGKSSKIEKYNETLSTIKEHYWKSSLMSKVVNHKIPLSMMPIVKPKT